MLAVSQRQRDLLAVRGERREDGEGQLDGLPTCLRSAERLTLVGDGSEQITDGAVVSAVHEFNVLDGFSLADTDGTMVDSAALLARGPLVVSFFRGAW